jgi:uncharacterized protein YfkK (UPF0435 family)
MKNIVMLLVVVILGGCAKMAVVKPEDKPGEFKVELTPSEILEMIDRHDNLAVEQVKAIRDEIQKTRSQIKSMVDGCICPNFMK